jgi:uncharacterized YigZ family protein
LKIVLDRAIILLVYYSAVDAGTEVFVFKISQSSTFIQEIKRSRFRAAAAPLANENSTNELIKSLSDTTANHNCWAWRVGDVYRYSDDGEPSGTAGKPILQSIDGNMLDGILVVVTRWFGGVLLGSGGLVRAYGGTAAECLKQAEKYPLIKFRTLKVDCSFADLGVVEGRLKAASQVQLKTKNFTALGAELLIDVPEHEHKGIVQSIIDATSGRASIADLD